MKPDGLQKKELLEGGVEGRGGTSTEEESENGGSLCGASILRTKRFLSTPAYFSLSFGFRTVSAHRPPHPCYPPASAESSPPDLSGFQQTAEL